MFKHHCISCRTTNPLDFYSTSKSTCKWCLLKDKTRQNQGKVARRREVDLMKLTALEARLEKGFSYIVNKIW